MRLQVGPARTDTTPDTTGLWRLVIVVGAMLLAVVVFTQNFLAGCTRATPDPVVTGASRPKTTIDRAKLGQHLVTTALVQTILADRAFVVADADLPSAGLLILTPRPGRWTAPVLVKVEGTVVLFRFDDFAGYGLGAPTRYAGFEGKRALRASTVRVFDGSPPPAASASTVRPWVASTVGRPLLRSHLHVVACGRGAGASAIAVSIMPPMGSATQSKFGTAIRSASSCTGSRFGRSSRSGTGITMAPPLRRRFAPDRPYHPLHYANIANTLHWP